MSADLKELYKAHKVAREDFVLTKTALKAGIAERLNDAIGILCECQSALSEVFSPFSLEPALRDIRAIQCGLTDADPGDAERTESEVADD